VAFSPSSTASERLLDALATFEHERDAFSTEFSSDARSSLLATQQRSLAERLLATAAQDAERRATLADFVGHAAHLFAPSGDAPRDDASAEAWAALVAVADALHGSGVYPLGRPRFVSDAFLQRLIDEAHEHLAAARALGPGRAIATAGDALAALAVSRQLREAVSLALGFDAVPTYDALYEFDSPDSQVGVHVDGRGYDIVVHLLLEHSGGGRSELIAHLPSATTAARVELRVGEALVLRGRGTLHSWRALGGDERRILTAIGFKRRVD
jgi:NAD(P)H-dependent FMN reductase